MRYCFNCGRELKDNEKCNCMDVKMSDDMIKNIQDNSYDIYSKDRLNDFIKNSIISNEKELLDTINVLNELEASLKKLERYKKTIDNIDDLFKSKDSNIKSVKHGVLDNDTVWKTKERYYEVLDEIKDTISDLEK